MTEKQKELVSRLRKFSTSELCDGAVNYHTMDYHIQRRVTGKKIVGPAFTVNPPKGISGIVPDAILQAEGRRTGNIKSSYAINSGRAEGKILKPGRCKNRQTISRRISVNLSTDKFGLVFKKIIHGMDQRLTFVLIGIIKAPEHGNNRWILIKNPHGIIGSAGNCVVGSQDHAGKTVKTVRMRYQILIKIIGTVIQTRKIKGKNLI